MLEQTPLYKGYCDYGTMFMSVVHQTQWEVEKWTGVSPAVTDGLRALREGIDGTELKPLMGRYETALGLTSKVKIAKGLGQGDLASPARAKLTLTVVQRAVNRLCAGYKFIGATRHTPLLFYADDSCIVTSDLATLQLAMDCMSVLTKILGLNLTIKGKKKTAWSGVYWEDGVEKDVTGWELELPDGRVVPQLTREEEYTYLGTELRTGWNRGRAGLSLRQKAVRKCKQLIGMIGKVPLLTQEQMGKAMSLGIAGVLGYYGRSTVITWEDCKHIETARAEALVARGFSASVPRLQIYQTWEEGGMGEHEHAYCYAAAAICDQIDRALSGGKGQPDKEAVELALAQTAARLGCAGVPIQWSGTPRTCKIY